MRTRSSALTTAQAPVRRSTRAWSCASIAAAIVGVAFACRGAATAAAAPPPIIRVQPRGAALRFVVTGDTGATHDRMRDAITRMHAEHPIDGILLVGDNFYPCGVSSLDDPEWSKVTQHFVPIGVPIYPVLGNHDYGDPPQCHHSDPGAEVAATGRIPRWNFPARTYEISSPIADIFMTDTEPIAEQWTSSHLGSQTSAEIVASLGRGLASSRAPVRIIAGHHPLYSSGPHGRARGPHLMRTRAALAPLLDRYGVTLYICGHDHTLELIGERGKTPAYLVSGAGSELTDYGVRTHAEEPPTLFPRLPSPAFYGFAVVDITRSSIAVTFFDDAGRQLAPPFAFPAHATRGAAAKPAA